MIMAKGEMIALDGAYVAVRTLILAPRCVACNFLAQCYAKRKMYDFAARTLQDAIKEKPVFDEEKKDQ